MLSSHSPSSLQQPLVDNDDHQPMVLAPPQTSSNIVNQQIDNPISLSASSFNLDSTSSTSSSPNSLHIVIVTSGSRGDVQPYIAIGLALRSHGYDVTIATERRMENLVIEFGLPYYPVEGDPTGLIYEKSAQKALQEGSMMKLIKLTEEWDKKFNKTDIFNSMYEACNGSSDGSRKRANAIISHPLTMTPTYCIAEKLNIPWIPLILGPTMPTSEFPIWPLAKMIPCACLNKWSYNAAFKMLWKSESKLINPWRVQSLGLPAINDAPRGVADIIDRIHPPVIIASSKLLCGPRGEVPTDYPANCHVVGFYFVPSANIDSIDPAVAAFFSSGSKLSQLKIVYLGFGSMPADNPLELVKLAVEITEKCNCRAVLVAGWSQLDSPECNTIVNAAIEDGRLLVLKSIPHDWILPRVDCIVHHCGVSNMLSWPYIVMD